MQACYSFVKEHCSAGLNCSLSCYRVATSGISKGTAYSADDADTTGRVHHHDNDMKKLFHHRGRGGDFNDQ